MTQNKDKKKSSGLTQFQGACLAVTGYLAGCVGYTIHQCSRADLPLEKTIVIGGLSFFISLVMPIAAGIIGHEVGHAGGALVGEVGSVSYAFAPQPDKKEKIEKFKNTAKTVGKAIGITGAIIAGLWAANEFLWNATDGAKHHRDGRKKTKIIGMTERSLKSSENTVFYPGSVLTAA